MSASFAATVCPCWSLLFMEITGLWSIASLQRRHVGGLKELRVPFGTEPLKPTKHSIINDSKYY